MWGTLTSMGQRKLDRDKRENTSRNISVSKKPVCIFLPKVNLGLRLKTRRALPHFRKPRCCRRIHPGPASKERQCLNLRLSARPKECLQSGLRWDKVVETCRFELLFRAVRPYNFNPLLFYYFSHAINGAGDRLFKHPLK